ncbi:MAG TPA: hypothetical protein VFE86_11895 [Ilumatobacteraceae bacterium]|nr:hypothetical protein [Ilumatobacteraceae bacterium]
MKMAAVALLLVFAGCADSGGTAAPKVIPTSSTTAEEARAIDGLVMRYPETSSTSVDLATLLDGVLQVEGDCLYLVQPALQQRFPILWPAGTRWDGQNQSVVSPAGEVMRVGDAVQGRGGYYFLSDIHLFAGTAASNLAVQCVDNGQIAAFQNAATAVGPKH